MSDNDRMMGFLLGAIVGAGAALLLAPASGRDTRRRIVDTTRDLADTTRDLADDARGLGKELRNRVGKVAGSVGLGKDTEPAAS